MPDIFDEVEEDLRAERARAAARRYGGAFVGALVLVLIGTGAYVWWQNHQKAAAEAVATKFLAASREADRATAGLGGIDRKQAAIAATDLQAVAADGPAGYRVLARLRLAGLQWQLGQHAEAVASWQSVSDDDSAPSRLRDLATLTSVQHRLDQGDPAPLKQLLMGLTPPENPWRAMAEQSIALLDLRQGKTSDAAAILRRLSADPTLSESARQIATDVLQTLGPDALAAQDTAKLGAIQTQPAKPVSVP